MPDLVARLLVVAGALALAVVIGVVIPRIRARLVARRPLDLSEIEGGIVLLSSTRCPSCVRARRVLDAVGAEYTEVNSDDDPDAFAATGAVSVPVLVVRGSDGGADGVVAGVPSQRRVRRLLRRARRMTKPS